MEAKLIIRAENQAGPALAAFGQALRNNTKSLREMSAGLAAVGRHTLAAGRNFSALAKAGAAAFAKVSASAAALAYGFKKTFVDVSLSAEQTGRTLRNSLGRTWGDMAMKELRAFSRATGRELGDAAGAYARLNQAGLKPTEKHLKNLADMAAKRGLGLTETSEAWARALKGEENALEQWGVKSRKVGDRLYTEYKDKSGKIHKEFARLGKPEALGRMLDNIAGATSGGAEAERAGTFGGRLERLGAIWKEFRLQVMDSGPWRYLQEQLGELMAWLDKQDLGALAKEWGGGITDGLKAISGGLKAAFGLVKEYGPRVKAFATSLGGLKGAAAALGVTLGAPLLGPLGGLIKSLGGLSRVLLLTPAGILLTLGAGFAALAREAGVLEPFLTGLSQGFEGLSESLTPAFGALLQTVAGLFTETAGALHGVNGELDAAAWQEMGKAVGELAGQGLVKLVEMLTKVAELLKAIGEGLGLLAGTWAVGDVLSQEAGVRAGQLKLAQVDQMKARGASKEEIHAFAAGALAEGQSTQTASQGGARGGSRAFARGGKASLIAPLAVSGGKLAPPPGASGAHELRGKLDQSGSHLEQAAGDLQGGIRELAVKLNQPQKIEVAVKIDGRVDGATLAPPVAVVSGQSVRQAQAAGTGLATQ